MSTLILAEHDGRQLSLATRQAITAAQLAQAPVDLLLVGNDLSAVLEAARAVQGVARVLVADAPHLAHPLAEDVAPILVSLAGDYRMILAAHGTFSRNILPRVAALLDVAMLSDVTGFLGDNTYVRHIYAGNLQETVRSMDPIQVLTVRGSRFTAAVDGGAAGVVTLAVPPATTTVQWLGAQQGSSEGPALGSARYVVSGGRSLGSAAQFDAMLSPLANVLGAALGATRAAVDAGFAPNEFQVGQTGTIVAPDCYIAVGISGAVQHTAGMKDSRIVVAINQDPDASIFDVADYGLVADLFETLPVLTEALRQARP
ncbi:MAG: FAD-binding protein [Formivibrio sp.]|nr:FAD-binding protein [Formivibrio sp.]